MVELNSDSESSINSDYMLDESESLQMRSRKENKKPMQVVNQNKYQTSNQNEPNLRVNTRGDKKDKNNNVHQAPRPEDYAKSPLISNVPKYFERKMNKAIGKVIDHGGNKNNKRKENHPKPILKNPFSPK